ncbi:hypothetical protein GALL_506720 [mine drainage metagenome]|uniref:Uncharacterized protein n=1 Tax=mine drainage metagenome TaxID=410659 RepID=A0A1J5PJN5_9ZZZZ
MVLPTVPAAAGNECMPSILISPGGPEVSLVVSTTGVAASAPTPEIGQIGLGEEASLATVPDARLVVQAALCQSG